MAAYTNNTEDSKMAKFNFALARYAGYYFDDEDTCVYSTKRQGAPVKLTWSTRNSYSAAYVTLSSGDAYGQRKEAMTLARVRNALKSTPIAEAPAATIETVGYPSSDFIAFSVKNKCSQYFSLGTSVKDALDIFKKRGIEVDPSDLRIMNPATGVITSLTVKTVKVYTLG
jgi:hypothetical protein